MLTEALINAGMFLFDVILNFLDLLPDMPEEVVAVLDEFFDLIFTNGWSIACFVIPMDFALMLLPLVIFAVLAVVLGIFPNPLAEYLAALVEAVV